jgi:hypothetical protein
MRMRGLEPPPSYLDTDLNRARLPIPPHPRGAGLRRYRTISWLTDGSEGRLGAKGRSYTCWSDGNRVERFASLDHESAPLSSRGLGRRPLMAETRVRIPVAVLLAPRKHGRFAFLGLMGLSAQSSDQACGSRFPRHRSSATRWPATTTPRRAAQAEGMDRRRSAEGSIQT